MRILFAVVLSLTPGATLSAGEVPVVAPVMQNATELGEPGRYSSDRSFDDTVEYYKRVFRDTGGVRWHSVINLPGIKAKHIECLRKKTRWEGINIYETKGEVRIYVIPRAEPQPSSTGAGAGKK